MVGIRHTRPVARNARVARPGAQLSTAGSLLRNLDRQLGSVRAQAAAGEPQPLDLVNARLVYEAGARDRLHALLSAPPALGESRTPFQSLLTLSAPSAGS